MPQLLLNRLRFDLVQGRISPLGQGSDGCKGDSSQTRLRWQSRRLAASTNLRARAQIRTEPSISFLKSDFFSVKRPHGDLSEFKQIWRLTMPLRVGLQHNHRRFSHLQTLSSEGRDCESPQSRLLGWHPCAAVCAGYGSPRRWLKSMPYMRVSQRYQATWNEEHGALRIDMKTCLPPSPRKGPHLEKSVDQRKTFGTNRACHCATPESTLPKTGSHQPRENQGAISHFCVQATCEHDVNV